MEVNFAILIPLGMALLLIAILLSIPLLSYLRTKTNRKKVLPDVSYSKPVSVIIAALNEEATLRSKIEFFLSEKGFVAGSEIVIVSAGSLDTTNLILADYEDHPSVKTLVRKAHMNKPLALNLAVEASKNELLIFSDCRQKISKGALGVLVSYFHNEDVGAVNSTIAGTHNQSDNSWIRKSMNWIYQNDSISGSSIVLHGALYAIRKEVFRPFPDDILADDLYASVSVIGQGKRLIQSENALIYDIQFEIYYSKLRLERLVRGLLIYLFRYWSEVSKMPLKYQIRFLLYKYLKLFFPFVFLCIGVAAVLSAIPLTSLVYSISAISVLFLFLIIPKTRNFMLFVFRFNVCFCVATFGYIFMNKRDVNWAS